jgi:hypothetical protein
MSDPSVYAELAAFEKRLKALERQEGGAIGGTWTPAVQGNGTAGVFTYIRQIGYWIRRSNDEVLITGSFAINTVTTPATGVLQITGMPYTALNVANFSQGVTIGFLSAYTYQGSGNVMAYIDPGGTLFNVIESASGVGPTFATAPGINMFFEMRFSAVYIAEP